MAATDARSQGFVRKTSMLRVESGSSPALEFDRPCAVQGGMATFERSRCQRSVRSWNLEEELCEQNLWLRDSGHEIVPAPTSTPGLSTGSFRRSQFWANPSGA